MNLTRRISLWFFSALIITFLLTACGTNDTKPTTAKAMSIGLGLLSEVQKSKYNVALEALRQKDFPRAGKILSSLAKEESSVAEIWMNLALAQFHNSEIEAAKNSLNMTFKLLPEAPQAHNLAGLIAVQEGKFDQAKEHYLSALKIDGKYANAHFNLALLLDVYLQDVRAAIDHYEKYLAAAPDDEQTSDWTKHLRYSLEKN